MRAESRGQRANKQRAKRREERHYKGAESRESKEQRKTGNITSQIKTLHKKLTMKIREQKEYRAGSVEQREEIAETFTMRQ